PGRQADADRARGAHLDPGRRGGEAQVDVPGPRGHRLHAGRPRVGDGDVAPGAVQPQPARGPYHPERAVVAEPGGDVPGEALQLYGAAGAGDGELDVLGDAHPVLALAGEHEAAAVDADGEGVAVQRPGGVAVFRGRAAQ